MKVLVVEDEKNLNNVIRKYLKKDGFSVDSAFSGTQGLDFLRVSDYDIVLMDIMMPQMDGITLLKEMRKNGNNTPVLILTAKGSIEDKVAGLNFGGDDYLVKPFEFEELIARMKAIIRRKYGNKTNNIEIGDLALDTVSKKVVFKNKNIELTGKEFAVLEYLMQNKNKILTRNQIREHAWDFQYDGESNIIDVIIKNIRRKFDEKGKESIIQTKRGIGYTIRDEENN